MEAAFATAKLTKRRARAPHDSTPSVESLPCASARGSVAGLPRFLQWSQESQPLFVQTKLVVGAPGDAYEREADRAAELAAGTKTDCPSCHTAMTPCATCAPTTDAAPNAARSAATNAAEEFVQPKAEVHASAPSPAINTIIGASGSGSPLPAPVREKVEPVLGADLSDVRVHTDAAAHTSARRLEAKAFTHQNHIWLGPHHSADDVELMAHELAHVVQQTGRDAPQQTLQRQAEESPGAGGDEVRERLQQRIDEALGDRAPARPSSEGGTGASGSRSTNGAASPAPATVDPEAREAARVTDRAALHERTEELDPDVQPAVDRVTEQQPQVEGAARSTVESLERPPGQKAAEGAAPAAGAQPQGAAAAAAVEGAKAGGDAGGQAAAVVQQAASAAEEAFAAAGSQPAPDTLEIITPPPEIAPSDAGGMPLPGNPEADARMIEFANEAQSLREQGQTLREHSAEETTNAQILRGNVGLVSQGIEGSQGDVQTAQGNLTFRRGLLDQSRQALGVSQQKAADVAARAPGGVTQTNENKSRSAPMASEARDLSSENDANTPEDPEAAAEARKQGGQLNRAGSDAATIDDTLTQVQGAANTLVQDAARASQLNTQASVKASAVEATLGRTEGRIAQMQGQNAAASGQLDALRDQPADVAAQASEIDVEGQDLIQASRDIEARLHATQQGYAEGMASVPASKPPVEVEGDASVAEATSIEAPSSVEASSAAASPVEAPPLEVEAAPAVEASAPEAEAIEAVAPVEEMSPLVEAASTEASAPPPPEPPPAEAPPPSEAEAGASEDVLVQRTPEDGAAPQPAAPQPAAPQPAAPQPSNINIASGLPSWLTGEQAPNEAQRERQQREQEERRQQEIEEINNELHGRRFEQLSAAERRRIALRLTTRNLFGGVGKISWPTPGGVARGAAHLAAGLIDPRAPMMGVVSGLNMIINSSVNFGREPSWGGALRLAANVATGLAIILGSITALAGVIAALMAAITIVTLGLAAPITGPVIAFCASVMSVVGGWTFWVGLIAAGLQALTFLVDLYMAGTAQTAEQLQQQSERMREDAGNAGNALMQAGMGKLAQVGGRGMQSEIRAVGGGVRFAARMGTRAAAAPGRAAGVLRSAGSRAGSGARALGGRVVSGARALPGRVAGAVRALPGQVASAARALPGQIAGGARSLAGRAASGAATLPGRAVAGARALGSRIRTGAGELGGRLRTGAGELGSRALTGARALAGGAVRLPGRMLRGARELPGRIRQQLRKEFSRDFLLGENIAPGSGMGGLRNAAAQGRSAARLELAAEAEARAARAAAAAEAKAAGSEAAPRRLDDAAPDNAATREASVGESSHLESNELNNSQLRNELEHGLERPGMAQGAPPNRRMKMGDHEWQERPGGIWCRHSGAEICVRTPHERHVQVAETEQRVQAARERVDQARARVEAERQRLTGPGSDVQRFDAELKAAREEAAGWREIADQEARAGNASAAEAARVEAATAEARAQQSLASKAQAEQQAAQGVQTAETQARVAQTESAAQRAEQQLARQRQLVQEIDDLERQLNRELQDVHRGVIPPSSSDWARRRGILDAKRGQLADEMYRARGVTPEVKLQLRAGTPPKGATARNEIIDNMDPAFKDANGVPLDITRPGQRIDGTVTIDHLVPFEETVVMDGFNELSHAQQLRVLNHGPNFIPLSGAANSSKLNRTLPDWFTKPGGRGIPPAVRADLLRRQGEARQSLRDLIDHFLRGGT